jgi:hypothetical protein
MSTKVEFIFDPFEATGLTVDKQNESDALEAARDVLLSEIISSMDSAMSPVDGHGKFQKLSKEYLKYKKSQGGSGIPDLELTGKLKDSIRVTTSGGKLKVTVTPSQQGKADGHCNFSGDSALPLRRFIPNEDDGETFKKSILSEIASAIEPFASEGD